MYPQSILSQKIFDGKSKTIYSVIDQPSLVCIQQKSNHDASTLITSITTNVYEILRHASMPTYFIGTHSQSDMFIAKKCTMIPIVWTIRRLADESFFKRHPQMSTNENRFTPPFIESFLKSARQSQNDENEQIFHSNITVDNRQIVQNDIEYMQEICSTVFDILEHIWMTEKHCQLIDLKLQFGITTMTPKEIVIATTFDLETWHFLKPIEIETSLNSQSIHVNLSWINNSLKDILDLNKNISSTSKFLSHTEQNTNENNFPSFIPSTVARCIIICSSSNDVEHAQKIKTTLNDVYNIDCDIRLVSMFKTTRILFKFLSNYSYEHCRPTIFLTLGNISNGLAMFLASNTQYPIIHCSIINKQMQNNFIDISSYIENDSLPFTTVFTLSSAIQNVIQILANHNWKLWTKLRGRRFKKTMDLISADQQLHQLVQFH